MIIGNTEKKIHYFNLLEVTDRNPECISSTLLDLSAWILRSQDEKIHLKSEKILRRCGPERSRGTVFQVSLVRIKRALVNFRAPVS